MQGQKWSIGIGFNAIDPRYSSELQNKMDQGGHKKIGKKKDLHGRVTKSGASITPTLFFGIGTPNWSAKVGTIST
jgi:hypothetical protein